MLVHAGGYEVIHEPGKAPIKAWVRGVELEDEARKQLINVASLPFIHGHIAVMPDVHWGCGATVGSVIPTIGAVVPAAVGVDIGCGMMASHTSLTAKDLPLDLKPLRHAIESAVPHGRTNDGGPGDRGAWNDTPERILAEWDSFMVDFQRIKEKHPRACAKNTYNHLGTLGTGNHFIEICLDTQGDVWIVLHSGSRGLGNRFGSYFIELAKEDMRQWFINLPDKDLSYFPEGTEHFEDYLEAVKFAQRFAMANREVMMRSVIGAVLSTLEISFYEKEAVINCHHNYLNWEKHFGKNVIVTRKGAVRAQEGDLGIIPGSMGARSYIVRGKGNRESFNSCSHGAGRRMSRGKAKKAISLADHAAATAGVECRQDEDVLDESPAAYKDIDRVMEAQSDLVEVVHTLKQVICVKG